MEPSEFEALQVGNIVYHKLQVLTSNGQTFVEQSAACVTEIGDNGITLEESRTPHDNVKEPGSFMLKVIDGVQLTPKILTDNGFVECPSDGTTRVFSCLGVTVIERQGEWFWQKAEQGQTELIPVRYFHDLQNKAGLTVDFDRTLFPAVRK